jgi:hypothetical protein
MKKRTLLVSALALAVTISSQIETMAMTNGMILITSRRQSDMSISRTDIDNQAGPGQVSPGDVTMQSFLGNYGYSCRLVTVTELDAGYANPCDSHLGNPTAFLTPANTNFNVNLLILTAAASVADNPNLASFSVPTMTGEFGLIGNAAAGSLFMYAGELTGNPNATDPVNGGQYMKVVDPTHPIMQGIPLDAQGRVKMVRDRYPEENAHVPSGGKANYEFFWVNTASAPAAGTTVLGVMNADTNRSCFAVVDVGGLLADGVTTSTRRLVHLPFGAQSSSNSRRTFNALSDIGQVIFIRAAKWAMGENLTPYQHMGNVSVALTAPGQIQLSWTGTADKNYKILATQNLFGPADFSNWKTVAQDIPGVNGTVTRTLNISASAGAALRVMPVP